MSEGPDVDCPVCGQPYQHYREEDHDEYVNIRDDATECLVVTETHEVTGRAQEYGVYVHVD